MYREKMKASVVILSQNVPPSLVQNLKEQTFQDFEIITASEDGIVSAMNKALAKAKGEIFIRIDDDVLLSNRWLENIIKAFDDFSVGGVTGPTYVPTPLRKNRDSIKAVDKPNWFIKWLFDYDVYAPAKIYNCGSVSYGSNFGEKIENKRYRIDHLEGTNWAMRTKLIKKVGGFDPKFDGVSEWFDSDVVMKVKKLGYRLAYAQKAVVIHLLEKTSKYDDRFSGYGRIKNWLRFHWRHSKFHYKGYLVFNVMRIFFY